MNTNTIKYHLKLALGFGLAWTIGFIMLVAGGGVAVLGIGGALIGISWIATFVIGILVIVHHSKAPIASKGLVLAAGILLLLFPLVGWILSIVALSTIDKHATPSAVEHAANANVNPTTQPAQAQQPVMSARSEEIKPVAASEKAVTKTIKTSEKATQTATTKTKTRKL